MARKTKTKTDTLGIFIPVDLDGCTALLGQLGSEQREIERLETEMNDRLSREREAVDAIAAVHRRRAEAYFKGIQLFAEAHREELCADGKKSKQLATGTISWRMTPRKVEVRDVAKVIAHLQEQGLDGYLRFKTEVDKEAILANPGPVAKVPGIAIRQKEEFIVEPANDDLGVPATKSTSQVSR